MQKIVDKYIAEESFFVEPDLEGENIIKADLLDQNIIKEVLYGRSKKYEYKRSMAAGRRPE